MMVPRGRGSSKLADALEIDVKYRATIQMKEAAAVAVLRQY